MKQLFATVSLLVLVQSTVRLEPFLYTPLPFQIIRTADCGCRLACALDLRRSGFLVKIDTVAAEQLARFRPEPGRARHPSCHIVLIDDYVIEGHVAAGQIQQLLDLLPDVVGLNAPLMPVGSLGGEVVGEADRNDFIFIKKDDTTEPFASYVARRY